MALVAKYPFNGNANDAANGNNGTANSVTYAPGKENLGALLNGSNSYVDANIPTQTVDTDFTMRIIFRRDGWSSGSYNGIIQMQNGSTVARYALWFTASNTIQLFNSGWTFVNTGISSVAWKYEEYVLDRSASQITLWKDGSPAYSISSSNNDGAYPLNYVRIWCRENVAEFVNGLVDGVELYNSLLSPAEKKNKYAFSNWFI